MTAYRPFVFDLNRTLFTGLVYPRFAAATMTAYAIGKVLYTIGYTTYVEEKALDRPGGFLADLVIALPMDSGEPKKRQYGVIGSIASIVSLP